MKVSQTTAYQKLKDIYINRDKQISRWTGKGIVHTLGADVPDEIIAAAGLMPVRVYGGNTVKQQTADEYLEYSFDPMIRSQFIKIISEYRSERLVISNSNGMLVRVYYYLKEMKRAHLKRRIPDVYFFDWLFTRYRMHQVYNFKTMEKFRQVVGEWVGKKVTDDDISAAIALYNDNRAALEQVRKLRTQCKISGVEALHIIGSVLFMPVEEHTALLKQLLKHSGGFCTVDGIKTFLTGSSHETTDVYEMAEKAGINIIAEDHDWGNRHFDTIARTDCHPIKALSDRYMLRIPNPNRSFVSQRVAALTNQVKQSGACAVIFYNRDYDDAASWDYPEQKEALSRLNIRSLQLEKQPLQPEKDLQKLLNTFVCNLKERTCNE